MKTLLAILLLLLAVLSCSRTGNNSSSSTGPKKLINIPQLMGKSAEEVKKLLGREPKRVEANAQYYAFDELQLCALDYKDGKFQSITLEGDGFHFATHDELAEFFGIDLKGQELLNLETMIYYKEPTINGVKIHHVSFRKRDDGKGYNALIFQVSK